MLGNGRRAYNLTLMRFHSPDRLSPFGSGGINAYAYCGGDPINLADPSGFFASPLVMMGLAVVGGLGGAGAFAAANPSGGGGEDGGVNPWIIGGVIAAVGMLAGVGMAGRKQLMKLNDSSQQGSGRSWANAAGGTSTGPQAPKRGWETIAPAPVAPATPSASRSPSPGPMGPVSFAPRDQNGMTLVSMKNLPSPVRKKILDIRDHGPHSSDPKPALVGIGKTPPRPIAKAPADPSGKYIKRHNVLHGTGHGYEQWRIAVGSTKKSGLGVVMVTPNHDESYFKVFDWSKWREP